MTTSTWVVVLEATVDTPNGVIDLGRLRRLLAQLAGFQPVGLHCEERFAVQVRLDSACEVTALGAAVSGLRDALQNVGVAEHPLCRAEVLSADEFDRDCRMAFQP